MSLKKSLKLLLLIWLILIINGCSNNGIDNTKTKDNNTEERLTVAVSIVPQETFVKAVGGDLVDVVTMIPPGNSPTNYQPTPKQMTTFSKSMVYFSIGVAAESANILPKVLDLNQEVKIVSLADKVGEVYQHRFFSQELVEHEDGDVKHNDHEEDDHEEHDHSGKDPHIWLSPRRVIVIIETIRDELISLDPGNKSVYEDNAKAYIQKLNKVDQDIKDTLNGVTRQAFIIYHPAFGYFAEDYGLDMVTIEEEGKEATAKKLQEVIDFAKKEKIRFIFYQEEFDSEQAETIAKEIEGTTVKVAPLAPNYIENMQYIADQFKEILNK